MTDRQTRGNGDVSAAQGGTGVRVHRAKSKNHTAIITERGFE